MKRIKVLKMSVNVTDIDEISSLVCKWAFEKVGRYICVSNVHMCMEVYDDEKFESVVNSSDATVPDGLPIVVSQKLLGNRAAQQVRGYDLVMSLCEHANAKGMSVGFYGSTESVLHDMQANLMSKFPSLNISYSFSPPYRVLAAEEQNQFIEDINKSDTQILFVGLGCPKQEAWMNQHKSDLSCVMLGVGAAFDFIAGNKPHCPELLQNLGLEWLFRLACEPRRLWKRYLIYNPRFVMLIVMQLIRVMFRKGCRIIM